MKTIKQLNLTISSLALVGLGFLPQYAVADFVINDDLIVDGSACIGFDCVNGESFGFDTIRIKENNLRIKFDDTSVAASFPRNDWQLTANDSANGGASKFSIDDISGSRTPFTVEANARSHSLYVDDGGRIGNRTSTPSVEIHTIDGDTPTLRLQQDGSSGFAPQTWDVAGNETNFFIRDVTNGSTLPFRIRPGAPTSSIEITGDGNVSFGGQIGIGTNAPTAGAAIHIANNGFITTEMQNTAAGVSWFTTNTAGGDYTLNHSVGAGTELTLTAAGNLSVTGNITAGTTGSSIPDYVFKDDYHLRSLDEVRHFIAAEGHLPGVPSANEIKKTGRLDMTKMQMKLLEKVEELTLYTLKQQETIDQQQEIIVENSSMKARLSSLEKLVTRLTSGINATLSDH